MAPAWLDSLSEDWPSQAGSEPSQSPKNSRRSTIPGRSGPAPRNSSSVRHAPDVPGNNNNSSSSVLGERSANEIGNSGSGSGSGSGKTDDKAGSRRSMSTSSLGSVVVHNTVERRSLGASGDKGKAGDTPEWRRRIVEGQLAYGEQLDLFSSARTGLENMFNPPAETESAESAASAAAAEAAVASAAQLENEVAAEGEDVSVDAAYRRAIDTLNDMTMPSSPPVRAARYDASDLLEEEVGDESAQQLPQRPRANFLDTLPEEEEEQTGSVGEAGSVRRHTAPSGDDDSSAYDDSQIHHHQQPMGRESRLVSGLSVLRNESFSAILISPEKTKVGSDGDGGGKDGTYGTDATSDYETMGGFHLRSHGRPADGSYRDRLLSTPIGNDTSEMLPEESLQASTPKRVPSIRVQAGSQEGSQASSRAGSRADSRADSQRNPQLPRVPNPNPEKRGTLSRQHSSPLKLFGPYDTFTNQTLMRRISQYEDDMSNGSLASGGDESKPHFGAGELDAYAFSDDQLASLSLEDPPEEPEEEEEKDEKKEEKEEAEAEATEPRFPDPQSLLSRSEALFPSLRSKKGELSVQRMRQSQNAAAGSSRPGTADKTEADETLATPRRDTTLESKRPRTSPTKDPTPKRRRTLHKSDVAFGIEGLMASSPANLDSVHMSHATMQSVLGRNRRDTRDGDELQLEGPEVLADRHILQPSTPPSQRGGSGSARSAGSVGDDSVSDDSVLRPRPAISSSGAASGVDGDRKPSIRTEDFINEAQKILEMIRGRESGLESVEESEMESALTAERTAEAEEDDVSCDDSTREPFSRPPSREGKPVPRVARVQHDPELVARLKKYEERSDLDEILTTTTRSIHVAQDAIRAEKAATEAVQATLGTYRSGRTRLDTSDDISDPPNIRITMAQGTAASAGESVGGSVDGYGSQGSVSSGGSIPTASSRGSDTRMTIAPQTVSHLIPDQVGNMVLDRDRNIWIKRRTGSSTATAATTTATDEKLPSMHTMLPSEGSEPDPFADIPDLSVDATMEFRRLKPAVASPTKTGLPGLIVPPTTVEDASLSAEANYHDNVNYVDNYNDDVNDNDNDVPVEHEISINEGRASTRKRLAISFSSPIARVIQDVESTSPTDEAPPPPYAGGPPGRRAVSVQFRTASSSSGGEDVRSRSASRGPSMSRGMGGSGRSFSRGPAFVPRPVSRIDEHDEASVVVAQEQSVVGQEVSIVGDDGQAGDVSVLPSPTNLGVLLTPGRNNDELLAQYVGMLSLSPMSEFTIHGDRSLALETSYVVGDRRVVTGDGQTTVLSQSVRALVGRLAAVQPFEPYWEDMEELDVGGAQLESLHQLDAFCPQLVTLDAAGNALRSVGGVPTTVRHLRLADNQLSALTAWGRLANLQYLDVSKNTDLQTLSGLKSLVHLRSLTADNCGLTCLDGITCLDALVSLRARGNAITAVDLAGTRLHKLEELDLEGNQIARVAHLDALPSLTSLNLRNNALAALPDDVLPRLRTLNISDNALTALNVRGLPSLRVLFADRNRLSRVRGFSQTPRLDSVSLREQALAPTARLDISSLYHAYEIRKLFLSGNVLETFDPPVDFLNLQLLELANCGLTRLPATLGQSLPNLRKVNLNYNALADLGGLRGIARLKRVLAAGNRLSQAYAVVQTLASLGYVAEVDLRDNPVTQGFYLGAASMRGVGGTELTSKGGSSSIKDVKEKEKEKDKDPFSLPPADAAQDKAYCSRLDLATGMRRRVYSQVFGDACPRLQQLDGLAVDRTLGTLRDGVWEALRARGIVADTPRDDSRWDAEDTFA